MITVGVWVAGKQTNSLPQCKIILRHIEFEASLGFMGDLSKHSLPEVPNMKKSKPSVYPAR